MADVISSDEYTQMKTWVSDMYSKTKGSAPTIDNITSGSVILAGQAQALQSLLNTAYDALDLGCSSHNTTVKSTNNSSQNNPYDSGGGASHSVYNASVRVHDAGDK